MGRIFDPSLQSGIGQDVEVPIRSTIEVLFFAFYLNSIQTDIGTVGLEFALRDRVSRLFLSTTAPTLTCERGPTSETVPQAMLYYISL